MAGLDSYSTIATWINANINTNGVNSLTGAKHNTGLTYVIANLFGGLLFDSTKPYRIGQTVLVENVTWGWELWIANTDTSAAAFNQSHFDRTTKRSIKLTTNNAAYVGIDKGNNVYTHGMGHTNFMVSCDKSNGASLPVNIIAKTNTTFSIDSMAQYANAKLFISEIEIP